MSVRLRAGGVGRIWMAVLLAVLATTMGSGVVAHADPITGNCGLS